MSHRQRRDALSRGRLQFFLLCALLAALTAAVAITAAVRPSPLPSLAEENLPGYVTRDLLDPNEWSRSGEALKRVRGVVLHYVGNPGTTAQANRNYFNSLADGAMGVYASSHFIVGLEGEVIQCVPLTEIAYASNARNDDTVSVEVCHPDETGEYSPAAYARAVELTAWLCRSFRLDPAEDVIRHYDVSGKRCPLYYVENPGAWEALLEDVAAEMKAQEAAAEGAAKKN